MALQMVVDTLDGMDEGIANFYVEKDGKFHLDVDGHDKNDGQRIPKARLDQEIQKRKESDQTLNDIAQTLVDDVPEDMRDLIPDLPPASKIKWIHTATKKRLFNPPQAQGGLDSKRPGARQPESFDDMTPAEKIKAGLKTIKK